MNSKKASSTNISRHSSLKLKKHGTNLDSHTKSSLFKKKRDSVPTSNDSDNSGPKSNIMDRNENVETIESKLNYNCSISDLRHDYFKNGKSSHRN